MYSLNTENPGDYLWDRLWMNGAEIRGGCERLPWISKILQAAVQEMAKEKRKT